MELSEFSLGPKIQRLSVRKPLLRKLANGEEVITVASDEAEKAGAGPLRVYLLLSWPQAPKLSAPVAHLLLPRQTLPAALGCPGA